MFWFNGSTICVIVFLRSWSRNWALERLRDRCSTEPCDVLLKIDVGIVRCWLGFGMLRLDCWDAQVAFVELTRNI